MSTVLAVSTVGEARLVERGGQAGVGLAVIRTDTAFDVTLALRPGVGTGEAPDTIEFAIEGRRDRLVGTASFRIAELLGGEVHRAERAFGVARADRPLQPAAGPPKQPGPPQMHQKKTL